VSRKNEIKKAWNCGKTQSLYIIYIYSKTTQLLVSCLAAICIQMSSLPRLHLPVFSIFDRHSATLPLLVWWPLVLLIKLLSPSQNNIYVS
jgi:hypothetical protein